MIEPRGPHGIEAVKAKRTNNSRLISYHSLRDKDELIHKVGNIAVGRSASTVRRISSEGFHREEIMETSIDRVSLTSYIELRHKNIYGRLGNELSRLTSYELSPTDL